MVTSLLWCITNIAHSHFGQWPFLVSHLSLFLNYFVLISSLVIFFVLIWWKTATFVFLPWTIKPALLTCLIRLWYDTDLKRARTCCVSDMNPSKITEQLLAICLYSIMSPDLQLVFGRGSTLFLSQNLSIFNGIVCLVDAFALNLQQRLLYKAVALN